MSRQEYELKEHVKLQWSFGDVSQDRERLAKDFNLKDFIFGWNEVTNAIELYDRSKKGYYYIVASYEYRDYSYARLYRFLRTCEENTAKEVERQNREISERNEKYREDKAKELAGKCGEYLNSKLNERISVKVGA